MDEQERREFEHDAAEHGIPLMLDRMGMDGLGNEVVSLYKRIRELEAKNERLGDLVRRCMRVGCQWCGLPAVSFDVEQRVMRQAEREIKDATLLDT